MIIFRLLKTSPKLKIIPYNGSKTVFSILSTIVITIVPIASPTTNERGVSPDA